MHGEVIAGDCREVLRGMADESVHCCVTSPPYWGLRDYGLAKWIGGDSACAHGAVREGRKRAERRHGKLAGGYATVDAGETHLGTMCRCGAQREEQIGLEEHPDSYVVALRDVFREVRRVLRRDGTLWLNLGDTYGGGKNLLGMPWRVALALQIDGWILRSDVIWAKPNTMPESVADRPTNAHEYVFMLTREPRYWYDADAVAEKAVRPGAARHLYRDRRREVDPMCMDRGSRARTGNPTGETRNRRSVWVINTQGWRGEHFATMPPTLARLCVRAGCRPGGTVLDPFAGSGTTGFAAVEEGRRYVLIEANPEYVAMAQRVVGSARWPSG